MFLPYAFALRGSQEFIGVVYGIMPGFEDYQSFVIY